MAENRRRSSMTQGSLARKLDEQQNAYEYQGIENNRVIKEIRLKHSRKKIKVNMVFKVIVVFSLALLVIFRYARITELGYEYNNNKNTLEDVRAENDRLNVDIEKSINLAKVRDAAENQLKMKKPDEYQKVQIDVKKVDVTEISKADKKEEKGLIGTITEWVNGLLGFMQ